MAKIQSLSLAHLIREPTMMVDKPPLLLLLHWVGSNSSDLMQLAPQFDGRFFIVSAQTPITLGAGANAWFHVEFAPDGPIINAEEAESSRLALLRFIDELVEAYGLDSRRVYLMGFSQGTIMSLSVVLTRPDKVAGVVAMSGRILPEIRPQMAPPQELKNLPILLVHGVEDPVLSIDHGRESRGALAELPVKLDYREYPMGHQVMEESFSDVAAWLSYQLHKKDPQARGGMPQ